LLGGRTNYPPDRAWSAMPPGGRHRGFLLSRFWLPLPCPHGRPARDTRRHRHGGGVVDKHGGGKMAPPTCCRAESLWWPRGRGERPPRKQPRCQVCESGLELGGLVAPVVAPVGRGKQSGLVGVLVREVTGNGIRRCHKYLAHGDRRAKCTRTCSGAACSVARGKERIAALPPPSTDHCALVCKVREPRQGIPRQPNVNATTPYMKRRLEKEKVVVHYAHVWLGNEIFYVQGILLAWSTK
jgi:hypothetical protein